jgi:DNA-binding transcriptional regulator YhcF (GntR family)
MARDAARIAPPSDLQVDRRSAVPVHVQLETQIRHLIVTGRLGPGMQLPTVRQLAGFLRINRNTAARALAELHRDGFLECRQGLGTFVSGRQTARSAPAARSLVRLADDVIDRARQLGFTREELMATLAARSPDTRGAGAARTPALLVECNSEELARYGEALEAEVPLEVDRVLVDDLAPRLAREPGFLARYRVVITTFFHIHEVKRALPPDGPPAVALLSEANIATLQRLTELPEGATIGLVCATATGSQNLLRSIQSAGLGHLRPVLASTDDRWSIARMLDATRVVVCTEQGRAALRGALPDDVELIVSDRTLDRGGLDMLRDLLARLEEPEAAPARAHP